MTVLGKILVICNLIFSLVTAALIVMVFLTRTNWKSAYDDLDKKYKVVVASARAYYDENQNTQKGGDARVVEKERAIATLQGDLAKANQAVKAKDDQLKSEAEEVAKAKDNSEKAAQDLKRRTLEVDSLTKAAADKDVKINDLEKNIQEFRDRAVAAEINYKSEHDRNTRLLAQLEKAEHTQTAKAAAANGNGAGKKAPPEDVKGSIQEVDSKSGLATISIGSDSGVSVGNTLEVYRLEPKPEYVGTVRVVDVHFKNAVVRPVMPLRAGPLRKGDLVSSRILTVNR